MWYIINEMIEVASKYSNNTNNIIREVLQKIILYSLSKTYLGNNCAFIGGTCLRIFHRIDRFSEDLDFVMLKPIDRTKMEASLKLMKSIIESFGLRGDYVIKSKSNDNEIIKLFFRFDMQFLYDHYFSSKKWKVTNSQLIKIKFDIDTKIFKTIKTETKIDVLPYFFETKTYDLPTLFAGKIGAILTRNWKNRGYKGRDLYDYIFYLKENIKINFDYLKEELVDCGKIKPDEIVNLELTKKMLIQRFKEIDYESAKRDAKFFIDNQDAVDLWSEKFFVDLTNQYLK